VPTRVAGVVEQLIVRVPAEDDVAEPEILVERREEFLAAEILAAHDPIAVEYTYLDMLDIASRQVGSNINVLLTG